MKRITNHKFFLAIAMGWAAFGNPVNGHADYASAVSALKPVAYYRFSETNAVPLDVTTNIGSLGPGFNGDCQVMQDGHGLPGAIVGDADTADSIDGTLGQQIVVPYAAEYNPNGSFSVEFWAKPATDSTASGTRTAVMSMVQGQNAANANDRSGWCVRHAGADWQFVLGDDHSDGATFYHTTLAAPGTAAENVWQHVVAVYAPGSVILYVNGQPAATDAPAKPLLPNSLAPMTIGDRGYTGWDYIGQLDEIAIYTNALSAADVQSHYQNGTNAARTKPYRDLVLEKAPPLYFRLDEPVLHLPVAANSGSLGQAANATYLKGTVPGAAGPQSPAVNGFETTNRAVSLTGGYVLAPAQTATLTEATFACWIRPNSPQAARAGIMHQRATANNGMATGFGFQDDGKALSYNWNDDGNAYNFNPNFVPPVGAWTFVAVTVFPDYAVLYMGTGAGLASATNTLVHAEHDFSIGPIDIGLDPYQATRLFKGEIDEYAMFDHGLTPAEIASMFNAALPAILNVTRTPADPIYEGMTVTFQAGAASQQAVTYQWRREGQAVSGATNAMLVMTGVKVADSGRYDVTAVSGGVTLTSLSLSLAVQASAPILKQAPSATFSYPNGTARFSSSFLGSEPLTYQWMHGGSAIVGATSASLVMSDLQPADAGDYTVVATNPLGHTEATASLTLLTPSKLASAIMDRGPVGYWRLDETNGNTAFDYAGNNNGTFTTGVANNVAGPRPPDFAGFDALNNAYDFTAGCVTNPPLNLNRATVTIIAWIKPNGAQPDYAGIVFSRPDGGTSGLDYKGSTGQLGYHWNDAAATYNWESGLSPTDAAWNFAALVVEPSKATLYLDSGTGLQSAVNEVTHGSSGFNSLVFGWDNGTGRQYKGSLDDVAIYDRALSAADITAIRNAGYTGTYVATPVSIVQQPKGETIMVGNSYTLSAEASGSVPLSYQWQKDGKDIVGAIRSSLAFASAAESDTGAYQLTVSQGAQKVTTTPVTLTVKPAPTAIDLPDSMVLHLKFDGNYTDASGRGNNGTAQGAPTFVAGKVGAQALHYSTDAGASVYNYVSLGNPVDLQLGTNVNFTVAFWIRFTGSPGDLPFLANNTGSMGDVGVTLAPSYHEGGWSWGLNDAVTKRDWPGIGLYDPVKNTLNNGEWHHLVHVFDRLGDARTYLDGVNVHTMSIAGAATWDLTTGSDWTIGQAGGAYGESGSFDMDDLGIWRRTLNHYEAQAVYLVGQNYARSFDTTAVPGVKVTIQRTANGVELSWPSGTLEASDQVGTGYATVAGAVSPFKVEPANGRKFYRVKVQ